MGKKASFLIVGTGFSGAVMARELAGRIHGCRVEVWDSRPHIAGNCHSSRDASTGVMVHHYGPHIFNTDNERVWTYVNCYGRFRPFINRVKAVTNRGIFSLPINLHTINQFFGKTFSPNEARAFLATVGDSTIAEPKNFEEQAMKMLGRELYEAFFRGYTIKQWGCDPRELPASVLKRLPVRFNYDDNYYSKKFQGIPEEGYSAVVAALLDHPSITIKLNTVFDPDKNKSQPSEIDKQFSPFNHVFYTGPLDGYFGHRLGRLGYRTVTFERIEAEGDYQGNAVMNYNEPSVPWTRIHEHKHFAPWETHERTVAFKEFSQETGPEDVPYYPKRLEADKTLLAAYRTLAGQETGVTFLGRLATYRYMDMEAVIGEALEMADHIRDVNHPVPWPIFPNKE